MVQDERRKAEAKIDAEERDADRRINDRRRHQVMAVGERRKAEAKLDTEEAEDDPKAREMIVSGNENEGDPKTREMRFSGKRKRPTISQGTTHRRPQSS